MHRTWPGLPALFRRFTVFFVVVGTASFVIPSVHAGDGGSGPKFSYEGRLDAVYTSNLFIYSYDRLARFDQERLTNPRYRGIDSISDVETRMRFGVNAKWKMASRRRFLLGVDATKVTYLQNGIADYTEVGARARFDTSKRSRWQLDFDQSIDRFKKNYRMTTNGTNLFAAAILDQTDLRLSYRRGLRGMGSIEGFYGFRDRSYNAGFEDRGYRGNYLGLISRYALGRARSKRGWFGKTRADYGLIDSETGIDRGVITDRSYRQIRVAQEIGRRFRRGVLRVDLEYRNRTYTTDVVADDARYNREDTRYRLRIRVERKLSRVFRLRGVASYSDNLSLRRGNLLTVDETGYNELQAGLGLVARF